MHSIDKINGLLDQSKVHKEQIYRSVFAEKNDERKHAGKRRQNNRQKDQGCENGLAPVAVTRQDVCQGYAEHRGRQQQQCAQQQGITKAFKVIGVFEKFYIIADAPPAGSRYFEAFHHQVGQWIKHEKGDDRPQEYCQRDVAARHITSFPACCVANG